MTTTRITQLSELQVERQLDLGCVGVDTSRETTCPPAPWN
jgi:hypothetical protein